MRLFLQNMERKILEIIRSRIIEIALTRLTNRIYSGNFEYEMSVSSESGTLQFSRVDVQ